MHIRGRAATAAVAAAGILALVAPAGASAITYPEPTNPTGTSNKPKGPFETLKVSKSKKAKFKTIQAAVDAAEPGDRIRIADGTYREGVVVKGSKKRFIKLIGNRKHPERVLLDGTRLKGARAQNGVMVNGADGVTIDGLKARRYKGNGFFLINVNGYLATNLIAERTGTYGIYAFNSIGGEMSDSEAYYVNDGAYYIGQTPPQVKPKRSLVKNVSGWGSVLGFSGTNMRYVTITESKFFNNGLGVVPNALSSEKYPPAEENVIVNNDIFWNNFNFYERTPFQKRKTATGDIPFPTGVGVLLLGGRGNVVDGNRIFGNYLMGIGMIEALTLAEKDKEARALEGNRITGNAFGAFGDRNGRDIGYEGGGASNCFEGNSGVQTTVPADGSTLSPCGTGANPFSESARGEMLGFVLNENKEAAWIKYPHTPRADGLRPLERWSPQYEATGTDAARKAKKATATAAAAQRKTVKVRDDYFSPAKLTVNRNSTITWRWPSDSGDIHDVKLVKGPKGVSKFASEAASVGYSYKRKLRKAGTYQLVCTFHEGMEMTIKVRR